jgi:hypothetical protein
MEMSDQSHDLSTFIPKKEAWQTPNRKLVSSQGWSGRFEEEEEEEEEDLLPA